VLDYDKAWFPGGEYYHTRVKTKKKEITCYYEQITIAEREDILRWLDRRTSGELIFDDRPYAVYTVRPTKKIAFKDYLQMEADNELYSGTFTITFSAHDPFARLTCTTLEECNTVQARAELGLLPAAYMPPAARPGNTDALVYNPGTETGHSIIRFAGRVGSTDLTIKNTTTGDVCKLKAGLETGDYEYYELDSKTGRVTKTNIDGTVLDFAFHDEGYITFAPCRPIEENIRVSKTANSRNITTSSGFFTEDMKGKYIYLDGAWRYIGKIESSTEAILNVPLSTTGTETTKIVSMNYLTILAAHDANITQLEIICKPEVR